jgi:hypothetical protein
MSAAVRSAFCRIFSRSATGADDRGVALGGYGELYLVVLPATGPIFSSTLLRAPISVSGQSALPDVGAVAQTVLSRRSQRKAPPAFPECPAVPEISNDPGRPETLVAELDRDPGRGRAPADHRVRSLTRELAAAAADRAEQRPSGSAAPRDAVPVADVDSKGFEEAGRRDRRCPRPGPARRGRTVRESPCH